MGKGEEILGPKPDQQGVCKAEEKGKQTCPEKWGPQEGEAGACWLLQEGLWCISLARRTGTACVLCWRGAGPWTGQERPPPLQHPRAGSALLSLPAALLWESRAAGKQASSVPAENTQWLLALGAQGAR